MTISYWKGMGWFSHGRQTGVMRPVAAICVAINNVCYAAVAVVHLFLSGRSKPYLRHEVLTRLQCSRSSGCSLSIATNRAG